VVPYAQELRDLGVDETLLRELSELTGGGALEAPKDAFLKARRQSRIAVEIWPWLVGLAAFLLIPDVALRRLGPGGFVRLGAALLPLKWRRRREAAAATQEGT
jgi:hypothetical protein